MESLDGVCAWGGALRYVVTSPLVMPCMWLSGYSQPCCNQYSGPISCFTFFRHPRLLAPCLPTVWPARRPVSFPSKCILVTIISPMLTLLLGTMSSIMSSVVFQISAFWSVSDTAILSPLLVLPVVKREKEKLGAEGEARRKAGNSCWMARG